MKNLIIGLLFSFVVISLMSLNRLENSTDEEGKGIQFEKGIWSEVLAKAKKENKIIFLDIYASWCGPCKKLKKTTFSSAEVGSFYNSKFINVAVDAEVGEGVALAQKYNVTGFPTLLFIKPDGSIHTKTMGYHSPSEFLELGSKVVKR